MSLSQNTSKHSVLRPIAIVLIAILVAYALYASRPEQTKQAIEIQPMLIDAIEVSRETIQMTVQTQGTVIPATETKLSSEVEGRIISVSDKFVAGGFFKKGDVLLKIDDLEYKTAVKRATASVAGAKTQLAEERGRAEVALQDWLRHNKEGKRSKQAKALALREPQIEEAEANLAAALADLEKAKEDLARTAITAPYDGLIRSRQVDLGQHVSVGVELGICFATDYVEVRLPVPEHKLALLNLSHHDGQHDDADVDTAPIDLSVALNDKIYRWQAKLARSESVLDDRSRVLHVVARVDDPYQLREDTAASGPPLRVGTFVNAVIAGKVVHEVARIPNNVLQTDGNVWLVANDGSMYQQAVKVIASDTSYAYVASGLEDADKIAVGYVDNSVPGTKVSIANLIHLPPASRNLRNPNNYPVEPELIPSTILSAKEDAVVKSIDQSLEDSAARGI